MLPESTKSGEGLKAENDRSRRDLPLLRLPQFLRKVCQDVLKADQSLAAPPYRR